MNSSIKIKQSEQFLVCSKHYVNVCYFIQCTEEETSVVRKYWVMGKGVGLEIEIGELGSCWSCRTLKAVEEEYDRILFMPLKASELESSSNDEHFFYPDSVPTCVPAQTRPTLCDTVDCSPPGFYVYGMLQARILEWVAVSCSKGSS